VKKKGPQFQVGDDLILTLGGLITPTRVIRVKVTRIVGWPPGQLGLYWFYRLKDERGREYQCGSDAARRLKAANPLLRLVHET
jgi:hypothetical protein